MTNEFVRYLMDQTSGVVISLVLIWRIEGKLDNINNSITDLAQKLVDKLK